MRCPRKRTGLELVPAEGGYVIEEPGRGQVHFLNPTAVVILELCDGRTPEASIEHELATAYGLTAVPPDLVPAALAQLEASGLIEWDPKENRFMSEFSSQPDRRAFVKQVIAGGVIAVPVVASFSLATLQGDAQTVASSSSTILPSPLSSSLQSSSAVDVCQTDPGYVGPGRFAAHLAYAGNPGDLGARINGEILFFLNDGHDGDDHGDHDSDHDDRHQGKSKGHARAQRVRTELRLTGEGDGGVVFASAALLVNSGFAVALNRGHSSFDATDVNASFCDLDFVLNAMASGHASVLVSVTYLGQPLSLVGPVAAAGPGFDFLGLRS